MVLRVHALHAVSIEQYVGCCSNPSVAIPERSNDRSSRSGPQRPPRLLAASRAPHAAHTYQDVSVSLSLSIYIYIPVYAYMHTYVMIDC